MTRSFPLYRGQWMNSEQSHVNTPFGVTGYTTNNVRSYDVLIGAVVGGGTFAVNAPFQDLAQIASNDYVFWAYANIENFANPPLSVTGTNTPTHSSGYAFGPVRLKSPIGNTATNSGSGSTASCSAITATNDHSLAVIVFGAGAVSPASWPQAGWTAVDSGGNIYTAYKGLTNAGDSTGAISFATAAPGAWSIIMFELLAADTYVGDYWKDGYPSRKLTPGGIIRPNTYSRGTPF